MRMAILCIAALSQLAIWYYLVYKILVLVNGTELMWFLYWIYIPAGVLTAILRETSK